MRASIVSIGIVTALLLAAPAPGASSKKISFAEGLVPRETDDRPTSLLKELDQLLVNSLLDRLDPARPVPQGEGARWSPDLGEKLYDLFRRGGSGFWEEERSAWLLEDSVGITVYPWPWSGEKRRASWPGEPPSVAVANVHTHGKLQQARPSVRGAECDYRVARSYDLPVYVLSRKAIWKITPEPLQPGKNPMLVVSGNWWKPYATAKSR